MEIKEENPNKYKVRGTKYEMWNPGTPRFAVALIPGYSFIPLC
jgi:hypothetical protein